jgi:hypothetical protein
LTDQAEIGEQATQEAVRTTAEALDAQSAAGTAVAWDQTREAATRAAVNEAAQALAATQAARDLQATRAALQATQTASAGEAARAAMVATRTALSATQTAAARPAATKTQPPPTRTPIPPTPSCSWRVEPQLARAWDRAELGCPTGPENTVWAAWEAFERGSLWWRNDTDQVYVLSQQGEVWQETPAAWRWDGSDPNGVGLSPPPGLLEPVRGFGYLWRNYLGGADGQLGWATQEERGFCATIQHFESGLMFRSNTVEFCEDRLFNWATHPSFLPLLFGLYGNGTWQQH